MLTRQYVCAHIECIITLMEAKKMAVVINILRAMIATFDTDPPDNEFQRGYLQALLDLRREAEAMN